MMIQRDFELPDLPEIDETQVEQAVQDVIENETDTSEAVDVNVLARKVYALLMKEARLERERCGRSLNW